MSHAALRTILPVAGWTTERARAVEITRTEKGISPIFRGKAEGLLSACLSSRSA